MLPLQCPVNVTLSHATELSVRAGTTALAVVADALGSMLEQISNQAPEWMSGPTVRAPDADSDARTTATASIGIDLLDIVAAGGILAVGALQVWKYRQVGQRLAQVRAELAQQPPRPARVQHRRNGVDDAVALVPAADARVDAQRNQSWRDRAFTNGSTQGYLDASAGRAGQLVEIPDSGVMADQLKYFRAGYSLGFESGASYRNAAEDSA